MAQWITIYCSKKVEDLTIEKIQSAYEDSDLYTLAEDFDIEEDDVDEFRDNLQWKNDPIQFYHENERPVFIHLWSDKTRINEEIEELENLPSSIINKIKNTNSIIAIELGISQTRTMNEIIAFEIAYWASEYYDGYILDYNENWYDFDKNRWKPIE